MKGNRGQTGISTFCNRERFSDSPCSSVASAIGICDPADVQSFSASAKLTFAMIAITACCGACSVVYSTVQVGPNFRVRVQGYGGPVKGFRVKLKSYQGSGNKDVTVTDNDGFALFRGVRPGFYHLSADHDAGILDAGIPGGVDLAVKLDGPTDVTVPLKWPSKEPVLIRSLKGTIRGPDYVPGQSQPRLPLD